MSKEFNHKITISDSLQSLCLIGQNQIENPLSESVLSVQIGSKCRQIEASCFLECTNLEYVNLGKQCRYIGDMAFYNCQSLKDVNILKPGSGGQVDFIGERAFYGCNSLTEIEVNLSSSYYDTGLGEYCFSNCRNLQRYTQNGSSFLAGHMFAGCTSLTSITLPKQTSYVYPYCLAGIPRIRQITLPANIWRLSDYMFKDCSELRQVQIEDGQGSESIMYSVGHNVFDGCKQLTEITLPRSINSLSQIDENFLAGSQVGRVVFSGIDDKVFLDGGLSKTTDDWIDENGWVVSSVNFNRIADKAIELGIPVILVTGETGIYNGSGTSSTQNVQMTSMLRSNKWKSFMSRNSRKYIFVYGSFSDDPTLFWYINSPKGNIGKDGALSMYCNYTTGAEKSQLHVVYVKNGQIVVSSTIDSWKEQFDSDSQAETTSRMIDNLVGSSGTVFDVSDFKTELERNVGKFGSSLERIVLVSSSGTEYSVTGDRNFSYIPEVRVNRDVRTNFKYGTWYYNAIQLKEFADEHEIPVFVEFGDSGCSPCQVFKKEIFNNDEFQKWVKEQPYLFCKVETESNTQFSDPSYEVPYFVNVEWAQKAPGNPRITIPMVMFYWKDHVYDLVTYHFNPESSLQHPPFTMTELKDMIRDKFAGYQKEDEFVQNITIESKYKEADGDKLACLYYQPDDEDDYNGMLFACDQKFPVDRIDSVMMIEGNIINRLQVDQSTDLAPGIYQYFNPTRENPDQYDLYGWIFRIDRVEADNANIVTAITEFINKYSGNSLDGGEQYTTNLIYELDLNSERNMFEGIVEQADSMGKRMVIIYRSSSEEESEIDSIDGTSTTEGGTTVDNEDRFKSEIVNSDDFNGVFFVQILNSDKSSQLVEGLKEFIESVVESRESDITDDFSFNQEMNQIYCYQGCSSCTESGDTAILISKMFDKGGINSKTFDELKDFLTGTLNPE